MHAGRERRETGRDHERNGVRKRQRGESERRQEGGKKKGRM